MAHPTLVFSPAHNEFSDNVPPYTCVCLTTCIWHFRVVFPIMEGKFFMCGFQNLFTYIFMTHLWQLYFFFMLVKREKRDGKYPSTGGGPAEAVYRDLPEVDRIILSRLGVSTMAIFFHFKDIHKIIIHACSFMVSVMRGLYSFSSSIHGNICDIIKPH